MTAVIIIGDTIIPKSLKVILDTIPDKPSTPLPNICNVEHWFYPRTIVQLHRLLEAINMLDGKDVRNFYLVCFSNCVKKVSLEDLRLSVPVRLREDQYSKGHHLHKKTIERLKSLRNVDVLQEFTKVAKDNIRRNSQLLSILPAKSKVHLIFHDARNLQCTEANKSQEDESVQLIITSPPYAGAQKYIRASSLSLGWLGFCSGKTLRDYERQTIGREHYNKNEYSDLHLSGVKEADQLLIEIYKENPLRAHIAANYLVEMRDSLIEMRRVLKPHGYLALIVANNQVCGKEFRTSMYLQKIAESLGLTLRLRLIDSIHSRGLMTKRNKTASLISSEWVLLFQK